MARPRPVDLETFVRQQDASMLASVLLELAGEHPAVQKRLMRWQLAGQPDKLASAFRKTLAGWRRATRFLGYPEARAFGLELEAWLAQIEKELMPSDPAAALALAESFIEADAVFFDRADDSDGSVGDAIRAGCRLWLNAAARCETPASEWPARLARLAANDRYGAREELLRRADLLLDEKALRQLVAHFEAKLDQVLAPEAGETGLPTAVFAISASLSLLGEALRDPAVHMRAVLRYSPKPNANQKESFVRSCLRFERPAEALPWLDGAWQHLEQTRQRLRAEVLRQLGKRAESALIQQHLFEQSLAVSDLQTWLADLPEAARSGAIAQARTLALDHDDPAAAALVLIEIGADDEAESVLVAEPARVRGEDYGSLVPLAKALEGHHRRAGATVVYRALLTAILDRAYAGAYGHGARYWARLQAIADEGGDLHPLEPHAAFEASVRSKHARKSSFWARVNGTS